MAYHNAQEDPAVTSGYPSPSGLTASARRALRRTLDPEDVERAAALLCAEAGLLTLDREIFRRTAPTGLCNAFAVALVGEDVSPDGENYRIFHLRVTGRHENAAVLRQKFARIRAGLPAEEFTTVSSAKITRPVHFTGCRALKPVSFDMAAAKGAVVTTGVLELAFQVCIAP